LNDQPPCYPNHSDSDVSDSDVKDFSGQKGGNAVKGSERLCFITAYPTQEEKMRVKQIRRTMVLVLCLGLILAPAAAMAQKSKSTLTEKVNLNTATLEQLQTLPGVGPSLAKTIIDYRSKSGKFSKIEELLNVKGVGEKKYQKIKDRLVV
jgi:comEA protein